MSVVVVLLPGESCPMHGHFFRKGQCFAYQTNVKITLYYSLPKLFHLLFGKNIEIEQNLVTHGKVAE